MCIDSQASFVGQEWRCTSWHCGLQERYNVDAQTVLVNARTQVSAGNQLFHVVVDTDEIATRITGLLAAEKAGRVTFVPLNRVRPSPVAYPTDVGDDAIPLVTKLRFEPAYRDAVVQVWMEPKKTPTPYNPKS